MQRINAPFELKDADAKGGFKGYVSVYNNEDLGGDIVLPKAFKKVKTTKDGKLRIMFHHDMQKLAGKASFEDHDHGFFLEGQLNLNVGYVQDNYEFMKDGTLDGMSVGFDILPGGAEWKEVDEGKWVRYIKSAELWEGSIVPFGMNPEAKIETVKGYTIQDIRKLEQIAKNSGCSRSEAVSIASLFKKHLSESGLFNPHSDYENSNSEMLIEDLKSIFTNYMRN